MVVGTMLAVVAAVAVTVIVLNFTDGEKKIERTIAPLYQVRPQHAGAVLDRVDSVHGVSADAADQ